MTRAEAEQRMVAAIDRAIIEAFDGSIENLLADGLSIEEIADFIEAFEEARPAQREDAIARGPGARRTQGGGGVTSEDIGYRDRRMICRGCDGPFIFSAREQAFYADHQLHDPRYCPTLCRPVRRSNRAAQRRAQRAEARARIETRRTP